MIKERNRLNLNKKHILINLKKVPPIYQGLIRRFIKKAEKKDK